MLSISIIIPVCNRLSELRQCLEALRRSRVPPEECIIADDSSEEDPAPLAREFGAKLVRTPRRSGAAGARNLGAGAARGEILLFLDSDVCVREDVVERVRTAFAADPELDAVIGSYDDAPAADGLVSQYRNLLHHYVHQNARRQASTFWGACGAVRAELFRASGGFDERYDLPSIEDVEFGVRLRSGGHKIELDPSIQVCHLKRWGFWNMIRTDVLYRGIPWTELILREHRMPDDLNVRTGQRVSVALTWFVAGCLLAILLLVVTQTGGPGSATLLLTIFAAAGLSGVGWINRGFYRFLRRKRGLGFTLGAIPLHFLYYLYSGAAFLAGVIRHAGSPNGIRKPKTAFRKSVSVREPRANRWRRRAPGTPRSPDTRRPG